MRVKKYLVNTIEEAEACILNDLGPTAMILSTRPLLNDPGAGEGSRAKIEVIAGAEQGAVRANQGPMQIPAVPTPLEFERSLLSLEAFFSKENGDEELYAPFLDQLVNNGISPYFARMLLKGLLQRFSPVLFANPDKVQRELQRAIAGKLRTTGPILLRNDAPQMIALIGSPGSGKTTTLAKLALQYRDVLFKKVGVITHAANRGSTGSKLRALCADFQLPMADTSDSTTLLEALDDYREQDLILIDTPGADYEEALVQLSSLKGLQMHIVVDMTMTEKEVLQSIKGYKVFDPAALIFTKLDQMKVYGKIYNVHEQTGIPLSYFGKGVRIPHDLEIADPVELANLILAAPLSS